MTRIQSKLEEIQLPSEGQTPFRINDMVRCTILVNTIDEIKDAYEALLQDNSNFDVIRVKNNLRNHV